MGNLVVIDETKLATFATMADASNAADSAAAAHSFADYQTRKADNTNKNQLSDLRRFASFLASIVANAPSAETLAADPSSWLAVTHGLVKAFVATELNQGRALGSINRSLSTIKSYAKLAFSAGAMTDAQYALIRTVTGYGHKEGARVDARREEKGLQTRTGRKKAEATVIDDTAAKALKAQPDTPQGRRDALLMCLLLDHGLRVGEVALLSVSNFNLKKGLIMFKRPKVDKVQNHKLSADTLRALREYADSGDMPAMGQLLRGSNRSGALTDSGMSERAIQKRMVELGERVGLALSPHDCRHYWATHWAGKVDAFRLQEAGGWNSLAMPRRYTKAAEIANEGMA